jgi:hypothetical protein
MKSALPTSWPGCILDLVPTFLRQFFATIFFGGELGRFWTMEFGESGVDGCEFVRDELEMEIS